MPRALTAFLTRRLAGRGRCGNVALIFALTAPALLASLGAGVDFALAVQFRTSLQNAVDSAALAGAAVYISSTTSSTATTVADNYMNLNITNLPTNTGVSYTVATASTSSSYNVTVTANANVQTTFMYMFIKSIPISATATAADYVVNAIFNTGSFTSSASDLNRIFWYVVPSNGTVPTWNSGNFPNGVFADGTFTELYSNGSSNLPPSNNSTFQIASGAQIGFAFVNVTGGLNNYGNNQYGGTPGSTHVFYSSLAIPNDSSNTPGGYTNASLYDTGTIQNCSLQTAQVTNPNSPPGVPNAGHCSTTTQTNADPTCNQLGSQTWKYFWNDMGGGTDDFDYNDGEYTFSCSSGSGSSGTGQTGVVLIN
jgi:Flp pilus assembly protein TadG